MKKEPCLYYHIHECLGYCTKKIPKETIDEMKREIITFLKGDASIVTKKLEEEMYKASEALNYERANELKYMLEDINTTLRKQKIDLNKNYNFDLVNYYNDKNYLSIEIFFIREGRLFGRHNEIIQTIADVKDAVLEYLIKFYEKTLLPKELYIPSELDDELISSYFNVKVIKPLRGKLKNLMDLACENAKEQIDLQEETLKKDEQVRLNALEELKKLLKLEKSFDTGKILKEGNETIAEIGDQLFTDVVGANRMKMFSILTNPISEEKTFLGKIKRKIEKIFLK